MPARVTPELRVGLAGCGRVAERGYLPALRQARGVCLVGVADPEEGRCEQVAADVPAHASLEALLAAEDVEAVVIATPTREHLAGARLASARGVPPLVEKPPTPTVADAAILSELAPAPWIAFNRRFDPKLWGLRSALPHAAQLELELRAPATRWDPHVPHDDALLDLGIHLIDIARWVTGKEVELVRTLALSEARAELELELNGSSARIRCAADRPWMERVVARGPHGRKLVRQVRGGLLRNALSLVASRREDLLVVTLTRQLEALALEIRGGGATPLARAADGVAALAVVEAARESQRRGGEPVTPAPAGRVDFRPARSTHR